ncbi:hypothetical protein [Streptomyces sp. NPDC058297]|uniref:hypothetical protein n=1 Tax=Streptomyces sp. NPDC058297 TaxID=3346433 RepID=UPI0036E9E487
MTVSACSSDSQKKGAGVSAGHLCDASFDSHATAAVKKISGVTSFEELAGKNKYGEPNRFSLTRAHKHLGTSLSPRTQCTVYKVSDESGYPFLQIDFKKLTYTPKREVQEKQSGLQKDVFYPIGTRAWTGKEYATSLYFPCKAVEGKGAKPFVHVAMYSATNQMTSTSTSKERMTILNSVSREFAKELGCLDEARLPARLPAPSK